MMNPKREKEADWHGPLPEDDLREHYITPDYLETMRKRARDWRPDFIDSQLGHFKANIPDYPEVQEVLEGELYARQLNEFLRKIRRLDTARLRAALEKYRNQPDCVEIIRTELEIRGGVKKLSDSSDAKARITDAS